MEDRKYLFPALGEYRFRIKTGHIKRTIKNQLRKRYNGYVFHVDVTEVIILKKYLRKLCKAKTTPCIQP